MMFPRQLIAIALLFGLSACDEPAVISKVDRRPDLVLKDLWRLQDDRGIPVEIHGTPFRRITDADLTAALKVPPEAPQEITFYLTPTGGAEQPWRIVLHFNPQGPPNASRDCGFTRETRTNALPEKGFSMHFVICKGREWKAHAFLEVTEIEEGDLAAFQRHVQSMTSAIFHEEKDP